MSPEFYAAFLPASLVGGATIKRVPLTAAPSQRPRVSMTRVLEQMYAAVANPSTPRGERKRLARAVLATERSRLQWMQSEHDRQRLEQLVKLRTAATVALKAAGIAKPTDKQIKSAMRRGV